MARANEGSHSYTCHPHIYPQVEWAMSNPVNCRYVKLVRVYTLTASSKDSFYHTLEQAD